MVNVTFTQNGEIFDKFNVPRFRFCQTWFSSNFRFPFGLEFEKTYYKIVGNSLTAFRILGYTINDSDACKYCLTFLVQLPNEEPQWISDFINEKTKVYASTEDYILSGGTQTIGLKWLNLIGGGIGTNWKEYRDRLFFKNDRFYTIKDNSVCESKGHYANSIFVTKCGWLVRIAKRSNEEYHGEKGIYLNKSDAMKVLLKDMVICDFAEEPISIDITIMPSTPKYTKVMIIE